MSSHEEDGTVSSFDTPEWPSSHAIFMRYAVRRRGGLAAALIIGVTAGIAYRLLMDPRHLARLRQLGVIKRATGTYRYYLTRAGRAAIAAGRRLTEHTIIPALANKLCSLFANTQLVSD